MKREGEELVSNLLIELGAQGVATDSMTMWKCGIASVEIFPRGCTQAMKNVVSRTVLLPSIRLM